MRVYKDRQYLVFDFGNKNCKYDFSTKTAIGFSGKPVKNICSQLAGYSVSDVFEACDDNKYAKFLEYIKYREGNIKNIGSILKKVYFYSNAEQLFSAGLNVSNYDSYHQLPNISNIPKGLMKICRDNNIKISNKIVDIYKAHPDVWNTVYSLKDEYMSLDVESLNSLFENTYYDYLEGKYVNRFTTLIDKYKYNAKALITYIDKLMTFEALDSLTYISRELCDYARMMSDISNKFERYPRNFLTTHKIACRNYNRLKQEINEKKFKETIREDYEISYGRYKFICPRKGQDIKDEAVQMSNCVASYIDRVINKQCNILFLRYKDSPEESLVTIEVRDNKIVQAFRKYNTPVTDEDQEAIDYFNRKFKEVAA